MGGKLDDIGLGNPKVWEASKNTQMKFNQTVKEMIGSMKRQPTILKKEIAANCTVDKGIRAKTYKKLKQLRHKNA